MKTNWTSPKTIVGPVATGDYYFPRTEIVDEIWDELEKGNFILLAAPPVFVAGTPYKNSLLPIYSTK